MLASRRFALLTLLSSALTLGAAAPAWADDYQKTIQRFRKAEESGRFFANAHGYAVFPTIGKGGIGVGGAYGRGRVYQQGRHIGDTSMTQLSIGFQLGGQGFSQIIFFENADALKKFTSANFEFGAEASAVVITVAAGAKAGTAGATAGASVEQGKAKMVGVYNNGMAVFTIPKGGLMYEATIAGQKFTYKKR
jgi:lipid-binding SYLF domain-containing protein